VPLHQVTNKASRRIFPCEYAAISARLKLNDRHWDFKGNGGHAAEFCRKYFEKDRLITVQYPEERNPLPEIIATSRS